MFKVGELVKLEKNPFLSCYSIDSIDNNDHWDKTKVEFGIIITREKVIFNNADEIKYKVMSFKTNQIYGFHNDN